MKRKKTLIIVCILAVIVCGVIIAVNMSNKTEKSKEVAKQEEAVVQVDDIKEAGGENSQTGGVESFDFASDLRGQLLQNVEFKSEFDLGWYKTMLPRQENSKDVDPNFSQYTALFPKDVSEMEVVMELEYVEGASVEVRFHEWPSRNDGKRVRETDNKTYSVSLNAEQLQKIEIAISNKSGEAHTYEFVFAPQYNINKFFKLGQSQWYTLDTNHHMFIGDTLQVTIPAEHSSDGKEFIALVPGYSNLYNDGTIWRGASASLKNGPAYGQSFVPSSDKGELKTEVIRNGEVIHTEMYKFDLSVIEFEQLDPSMYHVEYFIDEQFHSGDSGEFSAYVYYVHLNEKLIEQKYGEVKSFSIYPSGMKGNPTHEDLKLLGYEYLFEIKDFDDFSFHYSRLIPSSDASEESYELEESEILERIVLYDENYELVKAVYIPADVLTQ